MFKLGIVEQSLVISLDWCFIWIRTLLRFSLNFIVRILFVGYRDWLSHTRGLCQSGTRW
jgi:hypothetical protein